MNLIKNLRQYYAEADQTYLEEQKNYKDILFKAGDTKLQSATSDVAEDYPPILKSFTYLPFDIFSTNPLTNELNIYSGYQDEIKFWKDWEDVRSIANTSLWNPSQTIQVITVCSTVEI